LLLLCADPDPWFFVVNSAIPEFCRDKPHLLDVQVKLSADDHPFLDHDSFIDCSKIITSITPDTVQGQVLSDVGRLKGRLSQSARDEVTRAVQDSKVLSNREKNRIVNALTHPDSEA
jgi:hypothetical protein